MVRQQENPFVNICFNLVIPIFILNKGHQYFNSVEPVYFMLVALLFPIGYGLQDYVKNNKRKNLLSILGVVNILFTGGFALLTLDGFWFAVKEAFFPALIGIFCLYTIRTQMPAVKWFVLRSSLFRPQVIQAELNTEEKRITYEKILKSSTVYLSLCFFFSSILNFFLALKIFEKNSLTGLAKQQNLNEQIADMTWVSFLVIGLPLTLVMGGIFWKLLYELSSLTSLKWEELIYVDKKSKNI